jgi:hypothetical protein
MIDYQDVVRRLGTSATELGDPETLGRLCIDASLGKLDVHQLRTFRGALDAVIQSYGFEAPDLAEDDERFHTLLVCLGYCAAAVTTPITLARLVEAMRGDPDGTARIRRMLDALSSSLKSALAKAERPT